MLEGGEHDLVPLGAQAIIIRQHCRIPGIGYLLQSVLHRKPARLEVHSGHVAEDFFDKPADQLTAPDITEEDGWQKSRIDPQALSLMDGALPFISFVSFNV